jgi:hypothetical protein
MQPISRILDQYGHVVRAAIVAALLHGLQAGAAAGQDTSRIDSPTGAAAAEATESEDNLLPTQILDRPISELTIDIEPPASLQAARDTAPLENRAEAYFQTTSASQLLKRTVPSSYVRAFGWAAPGFFHRPLYFEQVNVERYGHHVCCGPCSDCAQSAVSAAHFFATVPLLPYRIGAEPCCERQYTLGHYRPGSCNPHQLHWPRLSERGLAFQAMAVTGLVFLIP